MKLLCPPNYCMVKIPKHNNNFVGSISNSYECISKDNRTVPVTIFKDNDENSCHLKELYHVKGYHNKNCDSSINKVIQLTPSHPKISTCNKSFYKLRKRCKIILIRLRKGSMGIVAIYHHRPSPCKPVVV